MSKFPGGIFSKSSGKVSGLVFSQARTRTGKVMTARELVIPSNPQTDIQQSNRAMMRFVVQWLQSFGPGVYRNDWDNGVGSNAGWPSLLSIIKGAYTMITPVESGYPFEVSEVPGNTDLGELHHPDSVTFSRQSAGMYRISWSTENGDNGSGADVAVGLGLRGLMRIDSTTPNTFQIVTSQTRSDGQIDFPEILEPGQGATGALMALYFRSSNPEPNNLSNAVWGTAPNS